MRTALIGWRNPTGNGSSKPIQASQSWTKSSSEQEAVPTEAPLPDAGDEPDDHEEQPEQNHEVPPARVELEAVEEHVLVDGRPLVLELVRRVERAVAGEADLHDDRCEEDQRPRPVEGPHAFLPVD